MEHVLLIVILVFVAIILFGLALPIILPIVVAIGLVISFPFIWVYEKIERKLRDYRFKRDSEQALIYGLNTYVYRRWKKDAKKQGISIEKYVAETRTRGRGAR